MCLTILRGWHLKDLMAGGNKRSYLGKQTYSFSIEDALEILKNLKQNNRGAVKVINMKSNMVASLGMF